MSESPSKAASAISRFFGDGPWRSKSVLAALAAVVVGLGSWVSNSRAPNETGPTPANPPGIIAPDSARDSAAGDAGNRDQPFPAYVPFCASYAVAYCLGWLFRKLMRLILIVSALAIALLMYGKFAGWDVTHTREQVKHGSAWVRGEATAKRDFLLRLLPSAVGASAGIFLGFRRRSRATTS